MAVECDGGQGSCKGKREVQQDPDPDAGDDREVRATVAQGCAARVPQAPECGDFQDLPDGIQRPEQDGRDELRKVQRPHQAASRSLSSPSRVMSRSNSNSSAGSHIGTTLLTRRLTADRKSVV